MSMTNIDRKIYKLKKAAMKRIKDLSKVKLRDGMILMKLAESKRSDIIIPDTLKNS